MTLKEQTLALNVVREPSSRACLLNSWDQEAQPASLHRAVHTITLPPSLRQGWIPDSYWKISSAYVAPELDLGDCLERISWPGQTHARASSKVSSADDGMPVLNPMPWSDLVCQRNFTDKTVARGCGGARKTNPNSLSSFRCEIRAFMTSFTRCTGKPVVNHAELVLFPVVFMLSKIFFYTRMLSFFGYSHSKS